MKLPKPSCSCSCQGKMYHHSRTCPPSSPITTCCTTPHCGRTMHQSRTAQLSHSSERMTNFALHSQKTLHLAPLQAKRNHQWNAGLAEDLAQDHVSTRRRHVAGHDVENCSNYHQQELSRKVVVVTGANGFHLDSQTGLRMNSTKYATTRRPRSLIKTF